MTLAVGGIYRLQLPSIGWVRVLPDPIGESCMIGGQRGFLVETLVTMDRWWATAEGRPNNHRSPWIAVPTTEHTNGDGK